MLVTIELVELAYHIYRMRIYEKKIDLHLTKIDTHILKNGPTHERFRRQHDRVRRVSGAKVPREKRVKAVVMPEERW